MIFGNWKIQQSGIEWNGGGLHVFSIPKDELTNVRQSQSTELMYDWILLATEEDWLMENDLYDLNYAFVYAAAQYNLPFDYKIFDATLAEQYEIFEAEERESDSC